MNSLDTDCDTLSLCIAMGSRDPFPIPVYSNIYGRRCGLALANSRRTMVHFQLSARAYAKLVCHSAKYPDREINGALIGTISKKDNCVQIQDTIPLFHIELGVAPMIEVALNQVIN